MTLVYGVVYGPTHRNFFSTTTMPPTFTQYPIPPIPEDFPLGSLSAAALSDWVAKNAYSTRTFDPWHAYFSQSSPPSPLQENDNIHSRVPIREQGPDIDKPSTKPGLDKKRPEPSTQLPSGLRDPADVSISITLAT